MTQITFFKKKADFTGFSVKGHSGYSQEGGDIVCAAVSSAVQLAVNTLSTVFEIGVPVKFLGNEANISAVFERPAVAKRPEGLFMETLITHFKFLEEDFRHYLSVTIMEE